MSKIYKTGEAKLARPFPLDPVKPLGRQEAEALFDIEKEAYEKGFETGERAGIKLGQEKMDEVINRLSSVLNELIQFKEGFYADQEEELVKLVMVVTTKVIHAELSINKDVVVNVLRAAIKAITTSEAVVIRMNPEDLDYVKHSRPDMLKNLEGVRAFSVEGDLSVGRGGCIIQSNHEEIDARIEEGLQSIEVAMREA